MSVCLFAFGRLYSCPSDTVYTYGGGQKNKPSAHLSVPESLLFPLLSLISPYTLRQTALYQSRNYFIEAADGGEFLLQGLGFSVRALMAFSCMAAWNFFLFRINTP